MKTAERTTRNRKGLSWLTVLEASVLKFCPGVKEGVKARNSRASFSTLDQANKRKRGH